MKVKDLLNELQYLDPEADVLIMSQESYPFENNVIKLVLREDFEDSPENNDVFLLEGNQVRYGNRDAWNC